MKLFGESNSTWLRLTTIVSGVVAFSSIWIPAAFGADPNHTITWAEILWLVPCWFAPMVYSSGSICALATVIAMCRRDRIAVFGSLSILAAAVGYVVLPCPMVLVVDRW